MPGTLGMRQEANLVRIESIAWYTHTDTNIPKMWIYLMTGMLFEVRGNPCGHEENVHTPTPHKQTEPQAQDQSCEIALPVGLLCHPTCKSGFIIMFWFFFFTLHLGDYWEHVETCTKGDADRWQVEESFSRLIWAPLWFIVEMTFSG